MRTLKILIISIIFDLTSSTFAGNQFHWMVGEKLVYKVRWAFVRLGTVQMYLSDTVRVDGHLLYKVDLKMDSNPVLIFVNLHNQYQCLVDSLFRPVKYVVKEKDGKQINQFIYWFDYQNNRAKLQIFDPDDLNRVVQQKELKLDHYMYDGISLTYFARGNAREGARFRVYSFVYDRVGPVDINFQDEPEMVYFKPIQRDLETFVVEGMFHLKGIAGVTGKYKSWFTHDDRRVPLGAKMKVFIGNVNVELESWEKWNP